ncbi:hypothetical protein BGZ83_004473 [Gryganskiella cystojenkinii]|nr:hypothetical protein BGZ83_004473 [Gryganskiella cystojenkinii]
MLPLTSLLLCLVSPWFLHHTNAQTTTPVAFQNIAYAASSILADGGFYLYGGVIVFVDDPNLPNTGTKQFLRLDLTKSFSTLSPPWTSLNGNLTFTMIEAAPSQTGQQMVLGGNRDHNGPLSYIYDINTKAWIVSPNIPSMPTGMSTYKRSNVGVDLDRSTGLVVMYGGFQYLSFSSEVSTLDTTSQDATKFGWDMSVNQTVIPPLYDPFVMYLPTIQKTLVMAGGDYYDVLQGLVGRCATLDTGYLISGGTSLKTIKYEKQALAFPNGLTSGPTARYQSCKVVMKDGNVFVQGGRDPSVFYSDAWILNVTTWTWNSVTISGDQTAMTRAGHACEMGPNGQILVVGGFIKVNNVSSYVSPVMAVIDTNKWTWKTDYTGAPVSQIWTPPTTIPSGNNGTTGNNGTNGTNGTNNNNNTTTDPGNGKDSGASSGLSGGAKGGIGAGVVLALLGIAGFVFYRRRSQQGLDKSSIHSYHQQPPVSEKKVDDGNDDVGSGSPIAASAGAGQGSPISLRAQVLQQQGSPSISTAPLSSAAMTTLPLYPAPPPDLPISTKPSQLPGSKFGGYFVKSGSNKDLPITKGDDDALAAAMFQAEDKVTSSGHSQAESPVIYRSVVSSPSNSQEVNLKLETAHISSGTSAGMLNPQGIARSPASTYIPPPSSTYAAANSPQRGYLNPQSVPEHEARIERSSPGVQTQVIYTNKDLDGQGLYPPLTSNRPFGAYSTIIGTPAAHPLSTAASSFSAAAAAAVADAANSPRTPTAEDGSSLPGSSVTSGYFAQQAQSMSPQQHYPSPLGQQQHGAPQTMSPYRDPRMMRDLDDIARMIESQTSSEPKGPHTVMDERK